MAVRKLRRVDLTVEPLGKFYRIDRPGRGAIEGSIDTILSGMFRLLSRWLAEDAHNAPILHAAIATIEGNRFAFLGDKGFGKTTLMLKLIEEGCMVEGDEHIVVTDKGAITRPRRLHVKEGSLGVVPKLSDVIRLSPSTTDWMGHRVFACQPSICGGDWEIFESPIHHLVFVEPNFGGSSVLSPISRDEAFGRLLTAVFMPSTSRGQAVARLRILSVDAKAWRLQAGNLSQATWHLRKVV